MLSFSVSSRILLLSVLLMVVRQGVGFSASPLGQYISILSSTSANERHMSSRLRSSKMSDNDDFRVSEVSPFKSTSPFQTSSEEDSLPSLVGNTANQSDSDGSNVQSTVRRVLDEIPFIHLFSDLGRKKLPPIQVDDVNVLLYDVFLIVNLALSISFWVTHRLDFSFMPSAFSEGCLFSILWIASGLYHGSFLNSAMDGHFPLDDENGRGGPKDAAALAFNTYINAINLRLVAALLGAWLQHRKVGMDAMEELIPLEIGCGLALMTLWRALHSSFTPRV